MKQIEIDIKQRDTTYEKMETMTYEELQAKTYRELQEEYYQEPTPKRIEIRLIEPVKEVRL
jgi:hypothetical protein